MSVSIEIAVTALNVRSGIGTAYPISSALFRGDHAVVDRYTSNAWMHVIAPHEGYIAGSAGGKPTAYPLDVIVTSPSVPPSETTRVRTTTRLNVRYGYGLNSPIVTTLEQNVTIEVYSRVVQYADGYTWYQLATIDQRWIAAIFTVSVIDNVPQPTPTPQPFPAPLPPTLPYVLPFSAAQRGVHGNAGGWIPSSTELDLISKNNIQIILLPTWERGQAATAIPAYRNAGVRHFILRASTHEKPTTVQRFLDLTIGDLKEYVSAIGSSNGLLIAIGNEPNVYAEGYGLAWQNGSEFAAFWTKVAQTYRNLFPGCKLGYPALSPGNNRPGVAVDEHTFAQQSIAAIRSADWIGLHAYWQNNDASDFAPEIAYWRGLAQGKPIIGTEIGPVAAGIITAEGVRLAYRVMGAASVPTCIWLLNGTGTFQNSDWTKHPFVL